MQRFCASDQRRGRVYLGVTSRVCMTSFLRRHPFATIVVIAAALRLGAAIELDRYVQRQHPPRRFLIEGDANGYWELARSVASGEGYMIGNRQVLRMPGFPLLLAAARVVAGDSVLAARLVLATIGAIGCGLVFLLGRSLFDERTGWLAGLWTSVSPTLVAFSPLILTETTFATCLTLSLLLLQHTHKRLRQQQPAVRPAILTGLAVGLATSIRPTWLLAAPAFLLALFWQHRTRPALFAGLGICLVTLLSLLPWGLRNQAATGRFVLTTLWAGPSLYDGLRVGATGESDMTFVETDGRFAEQGEVEANRYYTQRALEFVRQHPKEVAVLALRKLARFWSPLPNAAQFQSPLPMLACLLSFLPLIFFAVRGLWAAFDNPWAIAVCAGPVLYFSALHMIFVGSLRYRLPAEYPLSVLAAWGVTQTPWLKIPSRVKPSQAGAS